MLLLCVLICDSYITYMFRIDMYHKVETWCLQRNSFGVLSEEKRKYKYEAKHALKRAIISTLQNTPVETEINALHWLLTLKKKGDVMTCCSESVFTKGDGSSLHACLNLSYKICTQTNTSDLNLKPDIEKIYMLSLYHVYWVRSKGLVYILLTYM